jgi:hypothetical protein
LAISSFEHKFEFHNIHMKQLILVFFSLFWMTLNSFAQNSDDKIEFGLGITPCVAWIKPNTKFITSGGTGLTFGFGARVNKIISEKYAIGLEFNLQNISAKTHFDKIDVEYKNTKTTSNDFNINYNLRYIDIPILLKMNTSPKEALSYYGEFGGIFGILLNQKADIVSNELNLTEVNTKSPEDIDKFSLTNSDNPNTVYNINTNIFRIGMAFGGGIQIHLDNGSRVNLGLRYNLGLTDIFDDNKLDATSQNLGINMGFIF